MAKELGEKADKELKKLGKNANEGLKKIGKDIDKGVKKLGKQTHWHYRTNSGRYCAFKYASIYTPHNSLL